MKELEEIPEEILNSESPKEINGWAIKNGFLLPNGYSSRDDFSSRLGRDLFHQEQLCYWIIYSGTSKGPVSSKEIYREIYGYNPSFDNKKRVSSNIWALVNRVRNKLGKEAIISKMRQNGGYLSRRALIELNQKVKK